MLRSLGVIEVAGIAYHLLNQRYAANDACSLVPWSQFTCPTLFSQWYSGLIAQPLAFGHWRLVIEGLDYRESKGDMATIDWHARLGQKTQELRRLWQGPKIDPPRPTDQQQPSTGLGGRSRAQELLPKDQGSDLEVKTPSYKGVSSSLIWRRTMDQRRDHPLEPPPFGMWLCYWQY